MCLAPVFHLTVRVGFPTLLGVRFRLHRGCGHDLVAVPVHVLRLRTVGHLADQPGILNPILPAERLGTTSSTFDEVSLLVLATAWLNEETHHIQHGCDHVGVMVGVADDHDRNPELDAFQREAEAERELLADRPVVPLELRAEGHGRDDPVPLRLEVEVREDRRVVAVACVAQEFVGFVVVDDNRFWKLCSRRRLVLQGVFNDQNVLHGALLWAKLLGLA